MTEAIPNCNSIFLSSNSDSVKVTRLSESHDLLGDSIARPFIFSFKVTNYQSPFRSVNEQMITIIPSTIL